LNALERTAILFSGPDRNAKLSARDFDGTFG